jgi:hypothetical protein
VAGLTASEPVVVVAPADAPDLDDAAGVVVVVAVELPVVAGVVVEPAGTVEVAAADVVPAASGVVVVVPPGTVEEVVVGTGTTGDGPSPVQTVVEVVEGGTVASRRVVEVLVRVWVTGTLGGVSVVGGAVVGGAEVVVEPAGADVAGEDVGGEVVLAACPGFGVETFPAPEDLATEELGVGGWGVEGWGVDVVVAGRVVVVVVLATPAFGIWRWAALVGGAAPSS